MTSIQTRKRGQRRSKLLVPGDNWDMIQKASQSIADIVHLDLEDGVSAQNKAKARDLILKALTELSWRSGQEVWVRIAHFDEGNAQADLDAITSGRPNLIFMAKTLGPEDMHKLDAMVGAQERKHALPEGGIEIGAVIERVKALAQVEAIAEATPRMGVLVLGVADLSNEYGHKHSKLPADSPETLYLRSRMILAARVAGISVIDAPYMTFRDMEGSGLDAKFSAQLGFDGKSAISPKQIAGIHEAFAPSAAEIVWAEKVLAAAEESKKAGAAIFAVEGQIIELPHFHQAERILARSKL